MSETSFHIYMQCLHNSHERFRYFRLEALILWIQQYLRLDVSIPSWHLPDSDLVVVTDQ